jgi:hypothetical protein
MMNHSNFAGYFNMMFAAHAVATAATALAAATLAQAFSSARAYHRLRRAEAQ